MRLSHSSKNALRRLTVYAKYCGPAVISGLIWLLSCLKLWRLSNGDGTVREYQSLTGLASSTWSSCKKILASASAEDTDIALAQSLRPAVIIFWALMIVMTVLSFMLLCFALAAFSKAPESSACNRIKVWFRFFFPGGLVHFLLPLISAIPMFLPYYVIDRFEKYYAVSGSTEGDIGTAYVYYNYSVQTSGPNPLIIISALVILSVIVFILALPYERSTKLDLYHRYEEEKPAKTSYTR